MPVITKDRTQVTDKKIPVCLLADRDSFCDLIASRCLQYLHVNPFQLMGCIVRRDCEFLRVT